MVFRCIDGLCMMAQTLVMVSVFCRSRHSLVMPWKILQIGEPGRTVEQFFHDVAWAKIQSTNSTTTELISAYLGRSKESLDEVELSIRLDLAVATYGGYLRYVISQPERNELKQAVNAFAMLMPWWHRNDSCANKEFPRNGQNTTLEMCSYLFASKYFFVPVFTSY